MHILLKRIYNCPTYCIGHVYADGKYVCDTIEDTDRGLDQQWPLQRIAAKKVKSKTAIPTGTYRVTVNIVSPKFSQVAYYKRFCNGRVPRLLQVPGFDGILIHKGSTERSSAGCLIVGYNTVKGKGKKSLPLTETFPRTILPTVSRENISSRGRNKKSSPTCTQSSLTFFLYINPPAAERSGT